MLQQLQENYEIPKTDFFRYLQVRHFVKTHLHNFESAEADKLDLCFSKSVLDKRAISFLYGILQDLNQVKWEEELGLEILGEIWERALQFVNRCTLNARHHLIQFKIIHRLHYSKVKLSKIYPDLSPSDL